MRRAAVSAGLVLALLPACRKEEPAPAPPPPAPTRSAGADPAAQAALFRDVAAYTLTEATLDGIAAVDADLASFWADPANEKKIRGQLSLPAILGAIESTPEFVAALKAHDVRSGDYVLGTFAMLGGYTYEMVRLRDPKKAEGKKAPVNEATLELVRKRFTDVEKIVRPGRKAP